ncbi:MAG: hypothetical protein QOJ07_2388, partial [Thermoleophilaceae bacterium]|nr:hypothetical protein [Thermoleophilaceae bacterium]
NTDPHEYEPRPSDVRAIVNARVVLASGDGLDSWIGDVVRQSGRSPRRLDLGGAVPVRRAGDPHWWHDPRNARAAVAAIRGAFAQADPRHAREYAANARRYIARIDALDRGIARCFASVPSGRRKLVTDHDAFGYFANRYGIQVIGAVIPSQTTEAQPSAGDSARLAALIQREHVRAIFPEHSLPSDLADALAGQTGASAQYHLYGDTLGPKGSSGDTWLRMEAANADAMVRGFTGGARGCGAEA